jgi:EAL domain-containing protein (putative c-di-GMP-specific phosphodiesterase class I)
LISKGADLGELTRVGVDTRSSIEVLSNVRDRSAIEWSFSRVTNSSELERGPDFGVSDIETFIQPVFYIDGGAVAAYEVLNRVRSTTINVGEVLSSLTPSKSLELEVELLTDSALRIYVVDDSRSIFLNATSEIIGTLIEGSTALGEIDNLHFELSLSALRKSKVAESWSEMSECLSVVGVGNTKEDLTDLVKLAPAFVKVDASVLAQKGNSDRDWIRFLETLRDRVDGVSVVVERVEDEPTFDIVQKFGFNLGQGYYFGRPVTYGEFVASQR